VQKRLRSTEVGFAGRRGRQAAARHQAAVPGPHQANRRGQVAERLLKHDGVAEEQRVASLDQIRHCSKVSAVASSSGSHAPAWEPGFRPAPAGRLHATRRPRAAGAAKTTRSHAGAWEPDLDWHSWCYSLPTPAGQAGRRQPGGSGRRRLARPPDPSSAGVGERGWNAGRRPRRPQGRQRDGRAISAAAARVRELGPPC
jgi:hypothetical protein